MSSTHRVGTVHFSPVNFIDSGQDSPRSVSTVNVQLYIVYNMAHTCTTSTSYGDNYNRIWEKARGSLGFNAPCAHMVFKPIHCSCKKQGGGGVDKNLEGDTYYKPGGLGEGQVGHGKCGGKVISH